MALDKGLGAKIKDGKLFCHCNSCLGEKDVTAEKLVRHAGVVSEMPAELFIRIEKGKKFQELLEERQAAVADPGFSVLKESVACSKCGVSLHLSRDENVTMLLCDSCHELSPAKSIQSRAGQAASSSRFAKKKTPSSERFNSSKLTTKITRDMGFHRLIFSNQEFLETIQNKTVRYIVNGEPKLKGKIQGSRILCRHCNKVLSPSKFEADAGYSHRRNPYHNIFINIENKEVSLHSVSFWLAQKQRLWDKEHEKHCPICLDGGVVLMCELCPSVSHLECLRLSKVPKEVKWFCNTCKEKEAAAAIDPTVELFQRQLHIKAPEINVGACALCRQRDCSSSNSSHDILLHCFQCRKAHHVGCLDANSANVKELSEEFFCSTNCSMIHSVLQNLVDKGEQPLQELVANRVDTKLEAKGSNLKANTNIRWRIISGRTPNSESRMLLSHATSIFSEWFKIVDDATGANLVPLIVNSEKVSENLDYSGMYCVVLTVGSSVEAASVIQVLGCEVAELALIATKAGSEGLGYSEALVSTIERLLETLSVKHLVVPSADETQSLWKKKFGFSNVRKKQLDTFLNGVKLTFGDPHLLWKSVKGH